MTINEGSPGRDPLFGCLIGRGATTIACAERGHPFQMRLKALSSPRGGLSELLLGFSRQVDCDAHAHILPSRRSSGPERCLSRQPAFGKCRQVSVCQNTLGLREGVSFRRAGTG